MQPEFLNFPWILLSHACRKKRVYSRNPFIGLDSNTQLFEISNKLGKIIQVGSIKDLLQSGWCYIRLVFFTFSKTYCNILSAIPKSHIFTKIINVRCNAVLNTGTTSKKTGFFPKRNSVGKLQMVTSFSTFLRCISQSIVIASNIRINFLHKEQWSGNWTLAIWRRTFSKVFKGKVISAL